MAQTSFPWTSVGGDRTVSSADAAALYSALRSNRVLSGLTPTKDGSTVDVAAGSAIINGIVYVNSAEVTLTPSAGTRKDYIVLRLDVTNRTASLAVLEGTSGAFPTLTRDGTTWELAIASVDNSGGLFTVADTRADFTLCGIHNTAGTTLPAVTPATGWSLAFSTALRRVGDHVSITQSFTRTGDTITVPASGVLSSPVAVGTLPAGFRPWSVVFVGGRTHLGNFAIGTDGVVTLYALAPGATLATGTTIGIGGTFIAG